MSSPPPKKTALIEKLEVGDISSTKFQVATFL
jgi:hypothetical protein